MRRISACRPTRSWCVVTVDYLLCRQDKRFLDISDLSEEEAALVCGMVELLKKKDGKK